MDNIGDWLYIVFIIVAGVSGMISSGKKNRRSGKILGQPEEVSSHPKETASRRNIWEMFEGTEQSKPQPARQIKKESPSMKKQTEKLFLGGEKTVSSPVITQQAFSEMEIQEQEPMPFVNFRDADDLKKAVIYSEILNRKY